MDQPITSLFPSQSSDGLKSTSEVARDDDDYMVSFGDLQFDPEEEGIPDHMLISRKQFKILNRKLNSLLQIQADTGSRHSVSGIEDDVLLKAQEHRLKTFMEQIDMKQEERLKHQSESFVHEEDVNLKIEEVCTKLTKELTKLDHRYSNLYTKVDIIVYVVKTVVESYYLILTKVDTNSESDSQGFAKMEDLLGDLKALILQLTVSPSPSVSKESLSTLFSSLESTLKADFTPLLKLVKLMPSNAPLIKTRVQGGEKSVRASRDLDQGKVIGKLIST
ncbi:unnamed protein product [Lactuca saligna]|uniref:Uncharacterized protein n=1 Tax=Lactuca saligna TaxID=75948 RepID=A0AA35Z3S4_LACSI|nr:unnamed protein product [Lactuca saligna]